MLQFQAVVLQLQVKQLLLDIFMLVLNMQSDRESVHGEESVPSATQVPLFNKRLGGGRGDAHFSSEKSQTQENVFSGRGGDAQHQLNSAL